MKEIKDKDLTSEDFMMPASYGEAEYRIKKSQFISRVWPVETEKEALARIDEMKTKHYDATHNVYAYSVKDEGAVRFSDDGEPQGTSGIPTLGVFQSEDINNFCCVVTRYFGGVQLGAGGLVRAYSRSAKMGLDAAGVQLMTLWDKISFPCEYSYYERLKSELEELGGIIEDTDFTEIVSLTILSPIKKTAKIEALIQNISSGQIKTKKIDQIFQGVRLR